MWTGPLDVASRRVSPFGDGCRARTAWPDARFADGPVPAVPRRLGDGTRYRVVKVSHDAVSLTGDLTVLGWSARVRPVGGRIAGVAEPPAGPRPRAPRTGFPQPHPRALRSNAWPLRSPVRQGAVLPGSISSISTGR